MAAKGIEDTALYRHQRLVSLNDVGGDPDMFGLSIAAFHAASHDRSLNWPATMLCTTTHDAKRSEDVRCRIDVISEMPAAWRLTVRRWMRLNRRHKRNVDGRDAPSRNDEYLLYQLLVGSLPCGTLDDAALADYALRIEQVMLKSAREAKVLTSWINPHAGYEAALSSFMKALLLRRDSNLFLPDLQANVATLAWFGALNGLSMTLLKCLSPGVPDIYQGHEAIELSLVDPDNRRAVDFQRRAALLDQAQAIAALADGPTRAAALGQWLAGAVDGRAKFWVTWRALQLRRDAEAMLRRAEYLPLAVRGSAAQHVVAFARREGLQWLVAVAARLPATLQRSVGAAPVGECWGDTAIVWPEGEASSKLLPDTAWLEDRITMRRHALRDGVLPLSELLREWPVAALYGVPPAADAVDRPPAANAEP